MATKVEFDSKLSTEGRIVIPAAVRRALRVGPGDRVRLVLSENGEVRVLSARAMVDQVWANNTGGDAGDSVADMREFRRHDQDLAAARADAAARSNLSDSRSEEQIADDLMTSMGLDD